jgi:hypothetical protein
VDDGVDSVEHGRGNFAHIAEMLRVEQHLGQGAPRRQAVGEEARIKADQLRVG